MKKDVANIHYLALKHVIKKNHTDVQSKIIIETVIFENPELDSSINKNQYIKKEVISALNFLSKQKEDDENLGYPNTILVKTKKNNGDVYYKLNKIIQIGEVNHYNVAKNLYANYRQEKDYFDITDSALADITHKKQLDVYAMTYLIETTLKLHSYLVHESCNIISSIEILMTYISFNISIDIEVSNNNSTFQLSNVIPKKLIFNDNTFDIQFRNCQINIDNFKDIKQVNISNNEPIPDSIKKSKQILAKYGINDLNSYNELINMYEEVQDKFVF